MYSPPPPQLKPKEATQQCLHALVDNGKTRMSCESPACIASWVREHYSLLAKEYISIITRPERLRHTSGDEESDSRSHMPPAET